MTLLARVLEEREDDVAIAVVEGEIDASNTHEIRERLRALPTNGSPGLIADLTSTTYLDSAGIDLLFGIDRELRERRRQLHLVLPPSSPLARAVAITGLDAAVPVHPTREAAIATLRG